MTGDCTGKRVGDSRPDERWKLGKQEMKGRASNQGVGRGMGTRQLTEDRTRSRERGWSGPEGQRDERGVV